MATSQLTNMFPLERVLQAVIGSAIVFACWKAFQPVHRVLTSPLRHLRSPKTSSWLYGHIVEMRDYDQPKLCEEWVKEHGNTMALKGFFSRPTLFTVDTRAIGHLLTHSSDYQKRPITRFMLSQIFGEGLLVVEGAQHRQQRRIMNPAFGLGQIRALTDIFFTKSLELRDLWSSEIAKHSTATTAGARIDVVPWLSWITLDVIGLAGFNYDFEALNADGKQNQLNEAFSTMFSATQAPSIFHMLQARIPLLRLIPTERTRDIEAAQNTMKRIGRELLAAAKATARASATEKGEIEKNSLEGRDLLSLLVKANMATDIPESQKLSDDDVLAQVPTFLVAGHETTSTAITWALFAMSQAPDVQTKLREELLSVDTDTPSMDDLMALPYLDVFLRETLRLYPPVPLTSRFAVKDDVLPIEKPFTDKYGVIHDSIKVKKGDPILIHIEAMNHSKELWGPDAHEFKPERWEEIPEAASHIPGVWGHLLSFLGGPRGCIGFRFSLVETKAVLFTLVRNFEFELAIPASEIGSKSSIVQRPVFRGDPENKGQLPLLVQPYEKA